MLKMPEKKELINENKDIGGLYWTEIMTWNTCHNQWLAYHKQEIDGWQKMCERFVGCSMLSDEFDGLPHEPETFGNYVQNLLDQIAALQAELNPPTGEESQSLWRLK